MSKNPESELAKHVISYFENLDYTTYKEVSLKGGGTIRSDIYCKKDSESVAIEIKMTMCLKVIEQAFKWRPYANKVYIVIPKKGKINHFAEQLCQDYGIGLLYYKGSYFEERIKPMLNINAKEPSLYEEQLLSEASNNRGDFVTPFKITVDRIIKYVGDNKLLLKEVIENIEHHYRDNASATNSIKSMIKIGVIPLSLIKKDNKIWVTK